MATVTLIAHAYRLANISSLFPPPLGGVLQLFTVLFKRTSVH